MERPGKGSMNRLSDGAVESSQPADFDLQRLSEIVASAGSSAFSDANLLSLAELPGREIEAGKLELDLRECDIEELIGDTTDCMAHAARLKGLELSCQLDPRVKAGQDCDSR